MTSTVTASGPCSTASRRAARAMARRVSAFLRSRNPSTADMRGSVRESCRDCNFAAHADFARDPPASRYALVHYLAVHWEHPELPFAATTVSTCRYATFSECPLCGDALAPEHAHFRCRACGWRDSCCD